MSRYEIEKGSTKYIFGWDPPLQTYFLQVKALTLPEDDQIKIWLGTSLREILEVDELVRVTEIQGLEIGHRLEMDLYEDKDNGR